MARDRLDPRVGCGCQHGCPRALCRARAQPRQAMSPSGRTWISQHSPKLGLLRPCRDPSPASQLQPPIARVGNSGTGDCSRDGTRQLITHPRPSRRDWSPLPSAPQVPAAPPCPRDSVSMSLTPHQDTLLVCTGGWLCAPLPCPVLPWHPAPLSAWGPACSSCTALGRATSPHSTDGRGVPTARGDRGETCFGGD